MIDRRAPILAALALLAPVAAAAAAPAAGLDVRHYRLELRVDPAARLLRGVVTLRARPPASGPVVLDLAQPMVVDAVEVDGAAVAFAHEGDQLRLKPSGLRRRRPVEIRVAYHGTPQGRGFSFAERGGQPAAASFGMPFTARQWWPSHDDPADKAEDGADLLLTVPAALTAASNGRLVGTIVNPDGTRTFQWRVGYPVYADTLSVAAGAYVVFEDRYVGLDGEAMPLSFFVFPADEARARADFSVLPDILRSHAVRFGEYPFLREKYGVAEFTTYSFREHQTLPSYADRLVTGDHANDDILAHEAAHQWFGNSLTVRDWRHVWLNESFATYAAWLWRERRDGVAAYRKALAEADDGDLMGPVFQADVTDSRKMFGTATFQKGPWVLHMLRHVMGETKFFAALRAYVLAHAYGVVSTDDFQAACEKAYGRPLGWFFRQWIYGVSRPTYEVSWTGAAPGRPAIVVLRQLQTDAPVFAMPVDLAITTPAGVKRLTVWNDRRVQAFPAPGAAAITDVAVDPDGWILKRLHHNPFEASP